MNNWIFLLMILCCCNTIEIDHNTNLEDLPDSIPTYFSSKEGNCYIDSLKLILSDPLNLQEFANIKEKSRGGFYIENKTLYYTPKYPGIFYYYYFDDKVEYEHGTVLTVYKVTKQGRNTPWMHESDTLIELKSDRYDKDLGIVNFVNKSYSSIKERFGEGKLIDNGIYYYKYQNNVLILYTDSNNLVNKFKLIRLKEDFIKLDTIPNAIINY